MCVIEFWTNVVFEVKQMAHLDECEDVEDKRSRGNVVKGVFCKTHRADLGHIRDVGGGWLLSLRLVYRLTSRS